MSLRESNDPVDNQNSKKRTHLRGICSLMIVSFLLAILPTGFSILLSQLVLPTSPAAIAVFNALHCLNLGFSPVGTITFIYTLVHFGFQRSKIAIPDPIKPYLQVFEQSTQTDSFQDMAKKMRQIKDFVTLKTFFAFPAGLYETIFKKTYIQLLNEMNSLAGTLSDPEVRCHEPIIDREIKRLAGEGLARNFAHECETFKGEMEFLYGERMKIKFFIAKGILVANWITSVTDFSEVDNVITAIPLDGILALWFAIVLFYVGRLFMDIYGKEKYFFKILEKNESVKKFYEMKNEEMDSHLAKCLLC